MSRFRDVLPAGVSYVGASAEGPGGLKVEPRILTDAPGPGQTTLIFENLSDLTANSTFELTYTVAPNPLSFSIGDSYVNEAGAYINLDPRHVPDFGPDGTPTGDYTGSATDTATTSIGAIEIEKDEQSPEGELLRGVHRNQTVYTLTLRNNSVEPTSDLVVEDWLPAGLEFLGCGTDDNTTAAPTNPDGSDPTEEYPGSGPIDQPSPPATTDCETPDLVETVFTDPDGPTGDLPAGVYTHVRWTLDGELAAPDERKIEYVAAVPLRENTTDWGLLAEPPIPASLEQGSNLDNNRGPETYDEQPLVNLATVEGLYDGTLAVDDSATLERVAEDLAVVKGVSTPAINQGEISTWSLRIRTSEYRSVEEVRVEDTLPDGLCPLGPDNYEDAVEREVECEPTVAPEHLPSIPYTSVEENSDGSYDIVWDGADAEAPELALLAPDSELTITFPTRTRVDYQEDFEDDEPVLAEDSWENHVAIEGAAHRICAPADPLCS